MHYSGANGVDRGRSADGRHVSWTAWLLVSWDFERRIEQMLMAPSAWQRPIQARDMVYRPDTDPR